MILFPAIDLHDGCAVRLEKGDYEKVTVYHMVPEQQARAFEKAGATYLHLVDLDAAQKGYRVNEEAIRAIRKCISIPIQFGGGIRTIEDVDYCFETLHVDRVIIGTQAVCSDTFVQSLLENYGSERIVVSVDMTNGYVATHGWTTTTNIEGIKFLKMLEKIGVRYVLVTDIARDGMLSGANFDLYQQISKETSLQLILSGGIKDIKDIQCAQEKGYYGVITGRALYEGTLSIEEAIVCLQNV